MIKKIPQISNMSLKKWETNWVFDFYYGVQKFSAYNFFSLFSTESSSTLHFAFDDIHMEFKNKTLLLTVALFAKADETATKKNTKTKCVLEYQFTSTGLGGPILSKKSKSLYPNVHVPNSFVFHSVLGLILIPYFFVTCQLTLVKLSTIAAVSSLTHLSFRLFNCVMPAYLR